MTEPQRPIKMTKKVNRHKHGLMQRYHDPLLDIYSQVLYLKYGHNETCINLKIGIVCLLRKSKNLMGIAQSVLKYFRIRPEYSLIQSSYMTFVLCPKSMYIFHCDLSLWGLL